MTAIIGPIMELVTHVERIAAALERIASALEQRVEPVPRLPRKPTFVQVYGCQPIEKDGK